MMPEQFPAVEGGGSLILAWQIKNKHVLVVGGGEVSPNQSNRCNRQPFEENIELTRS